MGMTLNLIDFDGTLISNDDAIVDVYSKIFWKTYKERLQPEHTFQEAVSVQKRLYKHNIAKIFEHFAIEPHDILPVTEDQLKNEGYPNEYEIHVNPTIKTLMAPHDAVNIIVTHTSRAMVETVIESVDPSLFEWIDGVVTHEDVKKGKPAPDIYRVAYNIGQRLMRCMQKYFMADHIFTDINIYEDSEWGILAARRFFDSIASFDSRYFARLVMCRIMRVESNKQMSTVCSIQRKQEVN